MPAEPTQRGGPTTASTTAAAAAAAATPTNLLPQYPHLPCCYQDPFKHPPTPAQYLPPS